MLSTVLDSVGIYKRYIKHGSCPQGAYNMVELKKKQNKTTKALEDTYCTNYFYIKNILDNETK